MKKLVLAGIAAVVIAVPAILFLRVTLAERAWARSFGALDQWPERIRTTGNATAPELPQWSERVGLDAFKSGEPMKYFYAQLDSPSGRAQANERVLRFHAADIDAFADWIMRNPPPAYAHPLQSPDEPLPPVLMNAQLNHVLLAAAMARAAAGDSGGAEHLLDAAWRLDEKLRNGNVLFEQLVAMANFRSDLAALRKADVDSGKWLPRIQSVDFTQTIATSFQAETWRQEAEVRSNVYAREEHLRTERAILADLGEEPQYKPRWLQLLRTPIRWFDLPSLIEGRREMLAALPATPRSEAIDSQLATAYHRGFRRWLYIPDPDVKPADIGTAFARATLTLAQRELTERVLIAKTARRMQRRWPAAIDPSSRIEDGHWDYELNADRATIRFSRPMHWGRLAGSIGPLQCDLP